MRIPCVGCVPMSLCVTMFVIAYHHAMRNQKVFQIQSPLKWSMYAKRLPLTGWATSFMGLNLKPLPCKADIIPCNVDIIPTLEDGEK